MYLEGKAKGMFENEATEILEKWRGDVNGGIQDPRFLSIEDDVPLTWT